MRAWGQGRSVCGVVNGCCDDVDFSISVILVSIQHVGMFLTADVETELTEAWLSFPYRAGTARDRPESGGSREPAPPAPLALALGLRCPAASLRPRQLPADAAVPAPTSTAAATAPATPVAAVPADASPVAPIRSSTTSSSISATRSRCRNVHCRSAAGQPHRQRSRAGATQGGGEGAACQVEWPVMPDPATLQRQGREMQVTRLPDGQVQVQMRTPDTSDQPHLCPEAAGNWSSVNRSDLSNRLRAVVDLPKEPRMRLSPVAPYWP